MPLALFLHFPDMPQPLAMDRAYIQFTVISYLLTWLSSSFRRHWPILWLQTPRDSVLQLMNCMILVKLHMSGCQFCNQSIKGIFNVYDLISIIPLLDK